MTTKKTAKNECITKIETACERKQREREAAREEKVTYLWGLWGSHMAA